MAMNKKNALYILCSLFFATSVNSFAQLKYWVKFTNKTGTPYSVNNPSAFLTPQSILRRTFYNIPIETTDLPVNPAYVSQIASVPSATVLYVSKWLNGVVVSIPSNTVLPAINAFTFVSNSGQVNRYKFTLPKVDEANNTANLQNRQSSSSNTSGAYNYGGSYVQNHQLGVDCLHDKGFKGLGITIAVLDAGFYKVDKNPAFDSLWAYGRILGTRDFVTGGTSVFEDSDHGMYVLSCIAANVPSVIVGSAPEASFWLLRTEEAATESISEEYNWIRGAEFADSVGAHILTTSLGYTTFDNPVQNHTYQNLDGKTAPMTIAAKLAARKGMFVLNAAGNEGDKSFHFISVPGDADSICTVGAVTGAGNVAAFSSVGPTADGRIKPDLVARGQDAWVSNADGIGFSGSGTSFATPILAGAVACFWQSHSNYNSVQLLDTLRKIASSAASPNNSIGWGIPNMCTIPVGIASQKNEYKNSLDFTVYPNPFNSLISIKINSNSNTATSIEITDLLGKTISLQNKNTDKEILIDASKMDRGVYFLKISSASGSQTKKIIKQ